MQNLKETGIDFDAVAVTQSLLEEYYSLDIEAWLSALADDAMWIGPGNLFVFGAGAIRKYFQEIYMPKCTIKDMELAEIYRTETLSVVVGQFDVMANEDTDTLVAVHQRITFQYTLIINEWKLFHMHVSNEYNELEDDEVYPTKMGRLTYQYMQQLIAKKSADHQKLILEEDTGTHFVSPGEIIYVEALKSRSILHCINKNIESRLSITALENMLPPDFCRVHRSYVVNCNSIVRISRFMLELQGGFTIPLPEKRYTAIRDGIKAIIDGGTVTQNTLKGEATE